ncbi:uncharacterized protein ARMOST_09987 [Armillaria ostoyae]|uniref:Uncharacterized protein n=1 Tax=Armillaria ostoyae TaxID=47428 RepID=A0A284RD45_ARMOS|nr:uncharacterized protein ARMOST_09987 [Armillaria ostoyae]
MDWDDEYTLLATSSKGDALDFLNLDAPAATEAETPLSELIRHWMNERHAPCHPDATSPTASCPALLASPIHFVIHLSPATQRRQSREPRPVPNARCLLFMNHRQQPENALQNNVGSFWASGVGREEDKPARGRDEGTLWHSD